MKTQKQSANKIGREKVVSYCFASFIIYSIVHFKKNNRYLIVVERHETQSSIEMN